MAQFRSMTMLIEPSMLQEAILTTDTWSKLCGQDPGETIGGRTSNCFRYSPREVLYMQSFSYQLALIFSLAPGTFAIV